MGHDMNVLIQTGANVVVGLLRRLKNASVHCLLQAQSEQICSKFKKAFNAFV